MSRYPVIVLLLLAACGPAATAEGLGADCTADEDCGDGQSCVTHSGPECAEEFCRTCEIACDIDDDCPEGTVCNSGAIPPVPDYLPQVCVDAGAAPTESTASTP